MSEVYLNTKQQRCWAHKSRNILNKLPKSLQEKAKGDIHAIWMADTKENANSAFNLFIEKYNAKYPKAAECLDKDRDRLLTFYDFRAQHWHHIRTTNVVESPFATVKLRTYKTKGCLGRETGLSMLYKLLLGAEEKWPKLRGSKLTADVVNGVTFKNGVKLESAA